MNSAYWQIEMDHSDREKAAFTSENRLHQFARMLPSLKNTPATLQHVMEIILFSAKRQFSLVSVDEESSSCERRVNT